MKKYQILTNCSHLDSSSFSVQGKYLEMNSMTDKNQEVGEVEPRPITITKGYSRDQRPDLKQFIIDLIVSGDGGVPLFLRVADGNEQDKSVFGKIAKEYKSMVDFETMIVSDSALYPQNNLQLMSETKWLSRVPLSIKEAKELVNKVSAKDLKKSKIEGYSWKEVESQYGGVKQRWLVVESQKRKESDKIKLSEKIEKEKEKATKKLNSLMKQKINSSDPHSARQNVV